MRMPTAHSNGRMLSSTGSTAPSASLTQNSAPDSSPTAFLTHGTSTTHSFFALTPNNSLKIRFSGCGSSTGRLRFQFLCPVQYLAVMRMRKVTRFGMLLSASHT